MRKNKEEKIIEKHFQDLLENDPVRNSELDQTNEVDLPLGQDRNSKKTSKKKNNENNIIAEEC